MDSLARSHFAISYPCRDPSTRFGSPLYSFHVFEQEPHIALEIYASHLPHGLPFISSCNCISCIFLSLLKFMSAPRFIFIIHIARAHLNPSQVEIFVYLFHLDHPLLGGDLPPSVFILHMFPCIEHRYVPLLGTSLLAHDTRLLLYMYYKHFYSFSSFLI